MLLRFAVGNFLSFKDVTEFRMTAGKMTRHNSHVAVVKNGKRILKGGFIFGANASGKSNLIRAIDFARKSILMGTSIGDCYKKYFRIDNIFKDKPGFFQFDIFTGSHFYSYGFAVSYRNAEIEEEWLYSLDEEEKCIFERGRDKTGKMRVVSEIHFEEEKEKNRFAVYSEDIDKDEMKQKTFLSDMAMRSNKNADYYQSFRDVRNWFSNLRIVYPNSRYLNIYALMRDDEERLTVERLFRYFDTGIESLSRVEKSFDTVFRDVPEDIKISLRESLFESLTKKNIGGAINFNGSYYEFSLRDGELITTEVVSDHGNPNDLFEFKDESDGTKRLFDLLPIYHQAQALADYVIIIDELDRSLHTKATIEFIDRFYKEAHGRNCQLIASTHDSNIFDLDLLRQDEIWLVERMEDHASQLKSLSSYKPRFDKDVGRDYLIGRYGAIPIFNNLAILVDEDGESSGQ